MSYLKNLEWRYATKRMSDKKIAPEKLNHILEAIYLTPTSLGLQPFSVIVVEDKALKEKLAPACYNQPQIMESSALLVFAAWDKISDKAIEKYMNNIATTRGETIESTQGFKKMIEGFISNMTDEQKLVWASKQCYIALGFGLAAAALEEVDSTPMEGFNSSELDNILDLKDLGLKSVVIMALGYRNEKEDHLANKKKVRRPKEELFIKL